MGDAAGVICIVGCAMAQIRSRLVSRYSPLFVQATPAYTLRIRSIEATGYTWEMALSTPPYPWPWPCPSYRRYPSSRFHGVSHHKTKNGNRAFATNYYSVCTIVLNEGGVVLHSCPL